MQKLVALFCAVADAERDKDNSEAARKFAEILHLAPEPYDEFRVLAFYLMRIAVVNVANQKALFRFKETFKTIAKCETESAVARTSSLYILVRCTNSISVELRAVRKLRQLRANLTPRDLALELWRVPRALSGIFLTPPRGYTVPEFIDDIISIMESHLEGDPHQTRGACGDVCEALLCDKTSEDSLVPCLGCNCAHYCSKTCQKRDWPVHKSWCRSSSTPLPGDLVRIDTTDVVGVTGLEDREWCIVERTERAHAPTVIKAVTSKNPTCRTHQQMVAVTVLESSVTTIDMMEKWGRFRNGEARATSEHVARLLNMHERNGSANPYEAAMIPEEAMCEQCQKCVCCECECER